MENKDFLKAIEDQMSFAEQLLYSKNNAYNEGGDRLGNFKTAASLAGHNNQKVALGGMMAKHTISIYDMINSFSEYPTVLWEEKISDHINYLLLLKAMVVEEEYKPEETGSPELLTGPDWHRNNKTSPFEKSVLPPETSFEPADEETLEELRRKLRGDDDTPFQTDSGDPAIQNR